MIDFTTVVGVDDIHLEELRLTWPTWVKYRPQILEQPLVLVCDGKRAAGEWSQRLRFLDHSNLAIVPWDQPGVSQREKMLTGLTLVPSSGVATPWYLKLDTDAVALRAGLWVQDTWFEPDEAGRLPVLVASPWGYTKPADAIARLDRWGDTNPDLAPFPPLNLTVSSEARLLSHPRIISWCFFGNTSWTREVTKCCQGRLPVPSHDTFLWYCAQRRGDFYRTVRLKKFGWQHRRWGLRDACAQALAGGNPTVP